ncbi:MAG: CBS domain-containing protein [Phycisphaerae bacterium]
MGEQDVTQYSDPHQRRVFTQAVLRDLRALEEMIATGRIESGVRRIGAEQELFITDDAWRPAPLVLQLLEALDDDKFTTEIGRFNVEFNLDPQELTAYCFALLERQISQLLAKARTAAHALGSHIVLTGILPTARQNDVGLDNMTPRPRYHALNSAISAMRGEKFDLRIAGTEELNLRHDSLMLEACNNSCQVHYQVGAEEFARHYNVAQAIAGPVLAAACNSPLLFGKRLWAETRIALFEQAVDTRRPGHNIQERSARVSFGNHWLKESVLEIYEEDIARFRVIMAMDVDEDPFEMLENNRIPRLKGLTVHNSTVYRWNRPCFGVKDNVAHLRIENRMLPSGPTVLDEVSNAAFWCGLMVGFTAEHPDIANEMDFDAAKANFGAAARIGLDAKFDWIGGKKRTAKDLIKRDLLPVARAGLVACGVDAGDIDKYLTVIAERVVSGKTGAEWTRRSLQAIKNSPTEAERLRTLVATMHEREASGKPVHQWALAGPTEASGWRNNYHHVGQYMTTDVFTVHQDEVIDLVANVMAWRNVRHVPVEDDEHRLVGLVSYRMLLNIIARELPHGRNHPVAVSDIMDRNPLTVTPETETLSVVQLMQENEVSCLPVVTEGRLVGIVTEHDIVTIARHMLQEVMGN